MWTDCAHWDGVPFEGLDVRHWGLGPEDSADSPRDPEPPKRPATVDDFGFELIEGSGLTSVTDDYGVEVTGNPDWKLMRGDGSAKAA